MDIVAILSNSNHMSNIAIAMRRQPHQAPSWWVHLPGLSLPVPHHINTLHLPYVKHIDDNALIPSLAAFTGDTSALKVCAKIHLKLLLLVVVCVCVFVFRTGGPLWILVSQPFVLFHLVWWRVCLFPPVNSIYVACYGWLFIFKVEQKADGDCCTDLWWGVFKN